jgi:hypothetical protein
MLGNSSVAEPLAASQEGLSSMEFVSYYLFIKFFYRIFSIFLLCVFLYALLSLLVFELSLSGVLYASHSLSFTAITE